MTIDTNRVIKLRMQGLTIDTIAFRMVCSRGAIMRHLRRARAEGLLDDSEFRVKNDQKRRAVSNSANKELARIRANVRAEFVAARLERIKELYASGKSIYIVGREIGVTGVCVYKLLKDAGVTMRTSKEAWAMRLERIKNEAK